MGFLNDGRPFSIRLGNVRVKNATRKCTVFRLNRRQDKKEILASQKDRHLILKGGLSFLVLVNRHSFFPKKKFLLGKDLSVSIRRCTGVEALLNISNTSISKFCLHLGRLSKTKPRYYLLYKKWMAAEGHREITSPELSHRESSRLPYLPNPSQVCNYFTNLS